MDNTVIAVVIICALFMCAAGSALAVKLLKCKKRLYSVPAFLGLVFIAFFAFSLASVDTLVEMEITNAPTDVYITDSLNGGYRYGPAIIADGNGRVEAFFSTDYASSVWDVISYRTSDDGGDSWGDESVTLVPVAGSDEHYSNCDPGAFKVGDWYYVGYTSTFDGRGLYNFIYCARSKTPSEQSGWEKWNGTGWGGNEPKPILTYLGTQTEYGIGEPSFIYKDGTVYVYYTYIGTLGNGVKVRQTRVATAKYGENWCADIADAGVMRNGRGLSEDSVDVKYIPKLNKFLAVATDNRFGEKSYIKAFISDDGIRFYEIKCDSSKAKKGIHNIGVSGNGNGHIDIDGDNFVIYAYTTDGTWGKWNTALSRFKLNTRKVINLRKFFPDCAEDPEGKEDGDAWGLTSVETQFEDVPKGTYAASNVLKNDNSYFWSENYEQNRYATALAVRAQNKRTKGVKLKPMEDLEGVPVDFRFECSNDGVIWRKVEGSEVKGFAADEYKTYDFPFLKSVEAEYIRIVATKLGKLGSTELYALMMERFITY